MPADFGINHAHYVKIQLSTVLRRNKNMAVEGGWGGGGDCFSQLYFGISQIYWIYVAI